MDSPRVNESVRREEDLVLPVESTEGGPLT